MNHLRFAVAVSFVLSAVITPAARASCGSAECGYDRSSTDKREGRWVRLDYEFEYIDQNTLKNGTNQVPLGTQDGDHHEIRTVNRIQRVRLAGSITDRLSAELALPYFNRYHQHFDEADAEVQTWHLDGLGDLAAELRYDFIKPEAREGSRWSAIAGAEFPTGKHEIVEEDLRAEPPINPGSASYDFFAGAGWSKFAKLDRGELPLFLTAVYRINGRGTEDYKIGESLSLNAGLVYPIFDRLGAVAQLNFLSKQQDDRGHTEEQTERTGGDVLYASVGPEIRLYDGLYLQAIVQAPLYQRVNQVGLTSDWNGLLRLTWRLNY